MRKIIAAVLALIIIILLAPWMMGIWFQQSYQNLIAHYNAQGDVAIQLVQYHRGWWQSNAVVHIQIINPNIRDFWKELGIENPKLDFVVDQEIKHGPFIYQKQSALPSNFGLAAIRDKISISTDIQTVFAPEGSSVSLTQNESMVSFTGNYFKHFKTSPLQFNYPDSDVEFQFNRGISGGVWISSHQNQVRGDIKIPESIFIDGDNSLRVMDAHIEFDQYPSLSELWLGQSSFTSPEIVITDDEGNILNITGLNFTGSVSESAGKVSGSHNLSIEKINYDDELFGPMQLQMSVSGLDADAIADMITAYRKIMREGELYESQLQLKMSSMLPRIFAKHSAIKLGTLDITAPDGTLHVTGKMTWPHNESSASGLSELYQDSYIQADLRISKKLLNRIIDVAAQTPYLRSIKPKRREQLLDMQQDMQLASQRNYFFISMLVRNGDLANNVGLALLDLQRDDVSIAHYFSYVQTLFLDKQLSRTTSYMLMWQYTAVKQLSVALDKALMGEVDKVKQKLRGQINDFVKQGYITQDQNDYIVSIDKKADAIKMNGKEL